MKTRGLHVADQISIPGSGISGIPEWRIEKIPAVFKISFNDSLKGFFDKVLCQFALYDHTTTVRFRFYATITLTILGACTYQFLPRFKRIFDESSLL